VQVPPSSDCPDKLLRVELEVRRCIEELIQSHEIALRGWHFQELAKQREHSESIEHIRKRRAVLLKREAIVDKENVKRQDKEDEKATSKFAERERRILEREQAVAASRQQVDAALLANEERESDLDVRRHRLEQEAARLTSLKAEVERRLQETNLERAREGSHRETLDARERDLASSERSLASKRAEIGSLERALAEREQATAQLEKDLDAREARLSQRSKALGAAEADAAAKRQKSVDLLGKHSAELSDRTKLLNERVQQHSERVEKFEAREKQFEAKAKQHESQARQCSIREAALSEREAAVRLREQQASAALLQRSSGDSENEVRAQHELAERLRRLSEQERELDEQRSRLQDWESQLSNRRCDLDEAEKALTERGLEVEQQSSDIEARAKRSTELERCLTERERAQGDVEQRLAARGRELARAQQAVSEREAEQRRLQREQEKRAAFELLVESAAEEAHSDQAVVASRMTRRSAPPASFLHEDGLLAPPGSRRPRITARKKIGGGIAEFGPADDFLTPSRSSGPGTKRVRNLEDEENSSQVQDEAGARAVAVADPETRKDAPSGLSRLVAPIASALRLPFT
jgi:hypothetical protein